MRGRVEPRVISRPPPHGMFCLRTLISAGCVFLLALCLLCKRFILNRFHFRLALRVSVSTPVFMPKPSRIHLVTSHLQQKHQIPDRRAFISVKPCYSGVIKHANDAVSNGNAPGHTGGTPMPPPAPNSAPGPQSPDPRPQTGAMRAKTSQNELKIKFALKFAEPKPTR